MHDLKLVGVHDDGEHLLLMGADGQRFLLSIDEPLRAAVRRDRARLGQLQITMDGALRPRDIQARIRAGETASDIAAASGLPVEHVRRYEGAVLSERAHVADRARAVPVRRRQGQPAPLEELVGERLTAREASSREWDAWRDEDGTWTVQLDFRTGSKDRTARWRFDTVTASVEPLDDEARWLSADPSAESGPVGGRRLSAVKERVYDVEADGGVREHELDPDDSRPGERERRRTVDLLETLRTRRGRRQPLDHPDDAEGMDQALIDEMLEGAGLDDVPGAAAADAPTGGLLTEAELEAAMAGSEADLPPAAHPPASRPDEATDAHVLALPGTDAADEATSDDDSGHDSADAAVDVTTDDEPGSRRSRSKRTTVPSWDDIVFGARRD